MLKEKAVEIIISYKEDIFGFAMSKTKNVDKAEELAQRIVIDVYFSLLKKEHVENVDGYIYRICRNVYARFVNEAVKEQKMYQDFSSQVPSFVQNDTDEAFHLLRKEISYLSKLQREVIIMYYFQKMSVSEIADKLHLSASAVKWHLFNTRNRLKERIKMQEHVKTENKPFRFIRNGFWGIQDVNNIDDQATKLCLSRLVSQNILCAAYQAAKTITEIAETICTPASFVEDEVMLLEEHGLIEKMPGNKYRTNMVIFMHTKEITEQFDQIFKEFVAEVCETYVPMVLEAVNKVARNEAITSGHIYTPENDINFLNWAIVSFACSVKLKFATNDIDLSKYYVKRVGGGENIAYAFAVDGFYEEKTSDIDKSTEMRHQIGSKDTDDENATNTMIIDAWQFNTYHDNRDFDVADDLYTDYMYLYDFISSTTDKDFINNVEPISNWHNVEQISDWHSKERMFKKGYLVNSGKDEIVNIVVISMQREDFINLLPEVPENIKAKCHELTAQINKIYEKHYPKHIQEVATGLHFLLHCRSVVLRILEQLLETGTLKPLSENQKQSVNTIMFTDKGVK
ncbi:MAG: sigma-70 family RNA polymerase sigma factor [Candidatus Cloacimonetes bacterium]|nr:sigma-70 family RNA polymerase sigma factor [Candidatus Cloacimonadota bacterium]